MSARCELAGTELHAELRTSAAPEKVWAALTEAREIRQWFPDRAEGDAAPGAVLRWTFDDFHDTEYRVDELEAGTRLVLSTEVPGMGRPALRFEVHPDGAGTRLALVQTMVPPGEEWADVVAGMASGWVLAFRGLGHYLENYQGRERRHVMVKRPAAFEWEALAPFFREPDRLATWLTSEGAVGAEGSEVALALRGGGRVSGAVLARTSREVMTSWREIDGTLTLKAFAFAGDGPAGSRCIGVDFWGFGLDDEAVEGYRAEFTAALDALASALAG